MSLLNVEYKFLDTIDSNVLVTTAGAIIPITNIPQGDTSVSRDGAQVKITRFNFSAFVQLQSTLVCYRIMIIQDMQTNGALFSLSDLLQDIGASANIVSHNNLDNKFRFKVLYDNKFGLSDSSSQLKKISFNKDLDMRVRYDGTVGDITDLTSNSLSLVFISTGTGLNAPIINYSARIRYVDN